MKGYKFYKVVFLSAGCKFNRYVYSRNFLLCSEWVNSRFSHVLSLVEIKRLPTGFTIGDIDYAVL